MNTIPKELDAKEKFQIFYQNLAELDIRDAEQSIHNILSNFDEAEAINFHTCLIDEATTNLNFDLVELSAKLAKNIKQNGIPENGSGEEMHGTRAVDFMSRIKTARVLFQLIEPSDEVLQAMYDLDPDLNDHPEGPKVMAQDFSFIMHSMTFDQIISALKGLIGFKHEDYYVTALNEAWEHKIDPVVNDEWKKGHTIYEMMSIIDYLSKNDPKMRSILINKVHQDWHFLEEQSDKDYFLQCANNSEE